MYYIVLKIISETILSEKNLDMGTAFEELMTLRNEVSELRMQLSNRDSALGELQVVERRYTDLQLQYEATLNQYRSVISRFVVA